MKDDKIITLFWSLNSLRKYNLAVNVLLGDLYVFRMYMYFQLCNLQWVFLSGYSTRLDISAINASTAAILLFALSLSWCYFIDPHHRFNSRQEVSSVQTGVRCLYSWHIQFPFCIFVSMQQEVKGKKLIFCYELSVKLKKKNMHVW